MKGRAFYATVEIHNRLLDSQANKRLLTLGSGHYLWGGGGEGGGRGRYYFKSEAPKILAPLRLTAQKSCPPPKKCAQKIVILP